MDSRKFGAGLKKKESIDRIDGRLSFLNTQHLIKFYSTFLNSWMIFEEAFVSFRAHSFVRSSLFFLIYSIPYFLRLFAFGSCHNRSTSLKNCHKARINLLGIFFFVFCLLFTGQIFFVKELAADGFLSVRFLCLCVYLCVVRGVWCVVITNLKTVQMGIAGIPTRQAELNGIKEDLFNR